MAGSPGETHDYPAAVEDEDLSYFNDRSSRFTLPVQPSPTQSARYGAVEDDDTSCIDESSDGATGGALAMGQRRAPLPMPSLPHRLVDASSPDDVRCLAEKLEHVRQFELVPPELRQTFFHATVVQDRSVLSAEGASCVQALSDALRRVVLVSSTSGHGCAAIGSLDPSCSSPNDFAQFATSAARQFELAFQCSGLLFVCLTGTQLDDENGDGWLQFVTREEPSTISRAQSGGMLENATRAEGRADVIFVCVDGGQSRNPLLCGRSYSIDAMLSGNVQLAAMLERCSPRRSSWLRKRERRLEQWRSQRALELLMEEREEQHQRLLSTQRLLTSLSDQRSEHAAAVVEALAQTNPVATSWGRQCSATPDGSEGGRRFPVSRSPFSSSSSLVLRAPQQRCAGQQQQQQQQQPSPSAWLSEVRLAALMPSSADLVKYSCSQKHVRHFHEGENWSKLLKLPRFGIILLYGLPGVGKTQMALRFADCINSEKHPLPVFIYIFHFDTTEAFAADVSLLAEQLNVGTATTAAAASGDPSTLQDQFCSLIHALKSPLYADMHKVLILDGADASRFRNLLGKTALLDKLLERRTDFLFLLTATSCQHYETEHADSFDLLEIEPLSPKEVEEVMRKDEFFCRYGGDLPALARDLRTELCGLPLGLFPALAYMRRTSCTVKQYLQRLERAEVVAAADYAVIRSPPNQRTARQAIRLAVADLVEQQRLYSYTKATMVLLVACFARQELPTELLSSCLSLRVQRSGTSGDSLGARDDFGGDVDEIIGDLKAACLFENDTACYMDLPLVTVHKVVHDVLSDMLVRDRQGQFGEVLDLALRGAFLEIELDTRQRRSREHAILLHPHIVRLVALARQHDKELAAGARTCAKLCLVYLLQAAAYMHLEAGDVDAALAASSDALDCFCELLATTSQALMAANDHVNDGCHASGSSAAAVDCQLMQRLDQLAKATRMSRLLRQRRTHVTTKDWPEHMIMGDYERLVKQGSAIEAATLDALYPHELLAATLYMRGRTLKRRDSEAAGAAYRLCLRVCECVRLEHGGTLLVYSVLARRSGMHCLYPLLPAQPPQTSQLTSCDCSLGAALDGAKLEAAPSTFGRDSRQEAVWLRDTIERYKALARDNNAYYQMGMHKLRPSTDDLHQLLCHVEIVRCLQRLHRLVAEAERDTVRTAASSPSSQSLEVSARESFGESRTCIVGTSPPSAGAEPSSVATVADDAGSSMAAASAEALAIQRESFKHGQLMLEMAKEMDASLRGPCYIEHGHLTLQMLPGNGAAHAVPYYGCGLAELVAANMPARAAAAVRQIAERHRDLGRVPSDDLFGMITSHLGRLSGDGVAPHVKEALASMDALRAVLKLYQVLKTDPDVAAQRLRNAFGSVTPGACRATSTEVEEQAYAWHEAARETGYSDANIMKECRLWLAEGRETGRPTGVGETAEGGLPA